MRGAFRALLWVTGIGAAICALLYFLLFDYWRIPSGDKEFTTSILPTLGREDLILIQRGRRPAYGELARCVSPLTSQFVIGRVMGVEGNQVEVDEAGSVRTNGNYISARHQCPQQIINHPVTDEPVTLNCFVGETGAWSFSYLLNNEFSGGKASAKVEPGKLFIVSDNRLMHQDSRDFGLVDVNSCEHIVYRLWGEHFTDSSRRFTLVW